MFLVMSIQGVVVVGTLSELIVGGVLSIIGDA